MITKEMMREIAGTNKGVMHILVACLHFHQLSVIKYLHRKKYTVEQILTEYKEQDMNFVAWINAMHRVMEALP